jgi:hypothetical protein
VLADLTGAYAQAVPGPVPLRVDVEAGKAIYSPLVLTAYDAFVLALSNRFVSAPPRRDDPPHDAPAGPRHLEAGVGTGRLLDRCR